MIEKTEKEILILENFFVKIQNLLVQQNSWICYIECKFELPNTNIPYICLLGENGSKSNHSSGQKPLNSCVENIDLDAQNLAINLLGLRLLSSTDYGKRVSLAKNQNFENFLLKNKPIFLNDYAFILRRRKLEALLSPKKETKKQTKI